MSNSANSKAWGWVALAAAPMFFSTNIIFGRAANTIDPFTLAFLRWSIASTILVLIILPQWSVAAKLVRQHYKLLALAGFLAMWISGGIVYLALKSTTATNATLIYTTPPLMIIVIEYFVRGRPISLRDIIGIIVATSGILIIISGGKLDVLLALRFNIGDLLILSAATSWAFYSVLLKSEAFAGVPTLVTFAMIAVFGALVLSPFAAFELATTANYPTTATQWQMVAGIVLFSSLIPFSIYQFGLKQHGAPAASVFMYLLPPFGLGLAWALLGEKMTLPIIIGCAFVLGGVIIATFPAKLLRR